MIVTPRTALLAVAVTAALAGCGSSGGGGTSTRTTAPSAATPSLHAADPATTAAISKAYATFFGSASSVQQSEAALQHGADFAAVLVAQGKTSYASKSSATVSSVMLRSADVATMRFTISSNGASLLKDTPGFAVREGGTWKVAAGTFCALLTLEGSPPSACKDTTITALPH